MIAPTRPVLPPYQEYIDEIKSIWETGYVTNNGPKVHKFQSLLQEYTGCQQLDVFVNGHSALFLALKSMELTGEVITSPFTFTSTTNAIVQAGLTPVFCDIDDSYNIDPNKIEVLITDKTSAIVTPHIFGIPCDVKRIADIADKHNLKVIYDAAQAFGTKINNRHIVSFGDASMVSFHGIKVFNSIEGGLLVYRDATLAEKLHQYRNFGFDDTKTDVKVCGLNAKMNEFQAAMGIANLSHLEDEISRRETLANLYREKLANVPGIKTYACCGDIRYNNAYFPVLVDASEYGLTRDALYNKLNERGIGTRKLYDRLTADMSYYQARGYVADVPKAREIAVKALDLPMYGTLTDSEAIHICETIKNVVNE